MFYHFYVYKKNLLYINQMSLPAYPAMFLFLGLLAWGSPRVRMVCCACRIWAGNPRGQEVPYYTLLVLNLRLMYNFETTDAPLRLAKDDSSLMYGKFFL